MSETIQLYKPIKVGDKEYTTLELREPTPKDVQELGLPYRLFEDLTSEPVPSVCVKYIARLAAIPPSAVLKFDLGDFTGLLYVVVAFFNRSRRETPTN